MLNHEYFGIFKNLIIFNFIFSISSKTIVYILLNVEMNWLLIKQKIQRVWKVKLVLGHFRLRPSIKCTRNSNNLIGGEQKLVHLAFTLKANGQRPPNVYMIDLFGNFGAKSLYSGGKLVCNIYGNPNSPQANKIFFLNLYKVYTLYIKMDFYLIPSKRICLRSPQPHGHSVKRPLMCVYLAPKIPSAFWTKLYNF